MSSLKGGSLFFVAGIKDVPDSCLLSVTMDRMLIISLNTMGPMSLKGKTLVGTPIHRGSCQFLKGLFDEWKRWDKADTDFFIVYNGAIDLKWVNFLKKMVRLSGIENLRIEFQCTGHLSGWGGLTRAQNTIRNKALQENYEYLLFHEASRVPEPNALPRLLNFKKNVIGVLYKDTYHPGYYCVYKFDLERNLHLFEPYKRIGEIRTPAIVEAIGFGFTLIAIEVLKLVPFRSGKFASDTYFFEDMKRLNIPVYVAPIFAENLKIKQNYSCEVPG